LRSLTPEFWVPAARGATWLRAAGADFGSESVTASSRAPAAAVVDFPERPVHTPRPSNLRSHA